MTYLSRWLAVVLLIFAPSVVLTAESVNTLPAPTGYVNDFAGVLSPSTKLNLENLCTQVDRQAHAQIAVVTIKTLDNDQPIDEFATALEEKWKVGKKGTDRGVLMVVVMNPRKYRIEVGYGLEGILNDAKVGDIGRAMVPSLSQGDYNTAIPLGVQQIARIIAADAGVTLNLNQPVHQYHRQAPARVNFMGLLLGGGAILLILFFLAKTGNMGLIFFLLGNLMGGGFGGGRGGRDGGGGRDGDGGGGFGGFGGGSSGGGGASGDY
jgi:uncharacterized protein